MRVLDFSLVNDVFLLRFQQFVLVRLVLVQLCLLYLQIFIDLVLHLLSQFRYLLLVLVFQHFHLALFRVKDLLLFFYRSRLGLDLSLQFDHRLLMLVLCTLILKLYRFDLYFLFLDL
jgi:hypothetical protein